LLTFIFILTACDVQKATYRYSCPEEVQPHVDQFIKEASARSVNLNLKHGLEVVFVDKLDGYILATCHLKQVPMITISREFWTWADESLRERTVYHELAHCLMGRNHTDGVETVEGEVIYKSIMTPTIWPSYYYDRFKVYYLDELFYGN
jgi:hypothetical protein